MLQKLQLQRGLGIMINSVEGAEGISIFTTGNSISFLTRIAHHLICNNLHFYNTIFAVFDNEDFSEAGGFVGFFQQ